MSEKIKEYFKNKKNKKHEFSKVLVGKITLAYVFFGLILVIILSNEYFIGNLNGCEIVTTNMVFSKFINTLSKNTIFSLLVNALGLSLTPNASQLLAMLIIGYTLMTTFILLGYFVSHFFILPLITIASSLFMFYLKLTGNWIISSYTLINFYGLKVIRKLSDTEKKELFQNLYVEYNNNLNSKSHIFKGYELSDSNLDKLLEKYKGVNDYNLLKESFNKDLSFYTQKILTKKDILKALDHAINEALLKPDQLKLIDKNAILKSLSDQNLVGENDVKLYIDNYLKDLLNVEPGIDWSVFFGSLHDGKVIIFITVCFLFVIGLGYCMVKLSQHDAAFINTKESLESANVAMTKINEENRVKNAIDDARRSEKAILDDGLSDKGKALKNLSGKAAMDLNTVVIQNSENVEKLSIQQIHLDKNLELLKDETDKNFIKINNDVNKLTEDFKHNEEAQKAMFKNFFLALNKLGDSLRKNS